MLTESQDSSSLQYRVSRKVMNLKDFDEEYHRVNNKKPSLLTHRLRKRCKSMRCTTNFWSYIFPFYHNIASFYTWRLLASDIFAGLTVSSLHVPQGMAYGYLAGLKPVNGLYTSFFPALIYFFFGTSRHISIGTFSVVSLLVAEPVDRMTQNFLCNNQSEAPFQDQLDAYRLRVSVTVTMLAGLMQFLLGLFHLGIFVVYVSAPLLGGFTTAAAVHVFANQLNGLFGIKLKRNLGAGRLIYTAINFCQIIDQANYVTVLLSVSCIVILLVFKFLINPRVVVKLHFPIPVELLVLVLTTSVTYFARLDQSHGVKIAGPLPMGLPAPLVPDVAMIPDVLMESAIASFVALATTVSLVKLYATRYGYDVHYTRELTALGMANFFGGFFQCHCCSGGLARTTVAVGAGMQSQIASLISCGVLLLVLTSIGPLLETLPLCALSSIISVALLQIFRQFADVPRLYKISVIDMCIWLVTFFATVLIDIPLGLLVGMAFSVSTVLYRTHVSHRTELGHIPNTDLYVNLVNYDEAKRSPGIIILRSVGPLFYANAETLRDWIIQQTSLDPDKLGKTQPTSKLDRPLCNRLLSTHEHQRFCCCYTTPKGMKVVGEDKLANYEGIKKVNELIAAPEANTIQFIILDASYWSFIDSVGCTMLINLMRSYERINVQVLLPACQPQIRCTLISGGLSEQVLDGICFLSVHDAVLYAQQQQQNSQKQLVTSSEFDPCQVNCSFDTLPSGDAKTSL
ncbi:Cadherin EGF LAG seven-pass G-type receptor 3 [Paragonimus heterotremus]|uniref:Cadherin EGF LAG seven-pass G-type receptor 3 n=1 Tax=Paragonimus heterotremus TaxID=100268 RepID=A0A8J4TKL5_9TREM|nr:Cadherin EGF LAG seven-pass G-type receptor 3 [Paragonimus heterotremus]